MKESFETILKFWFEELAPSDWFAKSNDVDEMIKHRFSRLHRKAEKGELYYWRDTAMGRLAEILLLDQFSRNIYRGSAKAFGNDNMALVLSQELVCLGLHQSLTNTERMFAYMPYMHSESREVHEEAVRLFKELNDESSLRYELLHKDIIDRFGRFPQRNFLLGRHTTPKEHDFLNFQSGF